MNNLQANVNPGASVPAHPTCVLLVEDNPGDADLIQVLLRKGAEQPAEILRAERLSEALDILAGRPVQAVLLDLNLPDSSGIATVEATCQAAPSVPVVVLTGNNDKVAGLAAVQAGAQDFLAKGGMSGEAIWRVLRYAVERQRAQAEIAESRRFLQASLDALSARVVIVGQDGGIRFANRAWRESLRQRGVGELEANADYLATCARMGAENPAQLAGLAAGLHAVGSGEREHFAMEYCCQQPGETLWFQVRVTRFPAADGACVAVAHEDITQLKTAELREARLASVLRGVRNVDQLITKEEDPQRLIQSACENLTETMSYRSAWIALLADEGAPRIGTSGLAQDGRELVRRLAERDYPACVQRVLAEPGVVSIQRTTEPGCRGCPPNTCPDRQLLARLEFGGRLLGAISVTAPEIVTDDPDEQGLFAELVDDIAFALHKIRLADERREAEKALLASEQRYRALFENAPVGIFTTNQQGRVLQVNPALALMLGCDSPQEALDHYTDLGQQLYVDARRRHEFLEILRRDGEVHAFEYQARAVDGRPLWLHMDARIAAQEADGSTRIEGFTTDVTQRKLAEERLRENEKLYRLLADNTIDCIWLMGLDGTLQYVNPAIQQLLGYAPEEVVGTSMGCYCDEESLAIFQTALQEGIAILPRIETARLEAHLLRRDGSPLAVEVVARIIVDEAGRAVAAQGMARDITERRQATEAIRARENLLSKIFDVLPVGLWLADPSGHLYRSNAAGRRIWGAEPLVGRSDFGIFRARRLPSRQELAPEDWSLVRTIQDAVTIRNELLEIDAFDGVQRVILNSTAPVLNEAGEVEAAVVVNLDVTDWQRAEAERERLMSAIEQSQEMVVMTDPEGRIQYVNPAFERVTGYTRAEVLGENPRLLKSGETNEAFYHNLWQTILAGKTWHGQLVNRRKDGSLYTEESTVSPVTDEAGHITNFVALKHDITERLRIEEEKTRLEEQVQRNQRLESIGRLAGGVAHDLNNLLSPILGYTELLLDDPAIAPHCRESLAEISHAGDRARELVAQLLAFGRRQLLEFHPLDLNAVLGQFSNLLRRAIREDVEIVLRPAPELPLVQADAGQLEQVIMNLAVNAQDAMPWGGMLTIETTVAELDEGYAGTHEGVAPGHYVMLAVSDTGTGMDASTAARIFEPFFTTKEKGKGTGLGLATVYGIVRQHGGSIWVYSEPQQGTTFKVYLPVSAKAAQPGSRPGPAPPPARGQGAVLLVEDNDQVRGLAQAVLRRQGYTVLSASSGGEALALLATFSGTIDLLLTDVVMPGISGRELHDRIIGRFPGLKVLYMSGYTDNVIAHQGIIDPGVSFLQKPFSVKALAEKVAHLLNVR